MARPNIQPKLAIFWVFRGWLLKADTSLERGIHTREAINGQFDHFDFWPVLQRLWPELRGLQYEEVPRGRILFLKADRTFCVYMDKSLHTPAIKRLLLEELDLPKAGTKFLTDPHYTTDPEELDRLFDETGPECTPSWCIPQSGEPQSPSRFDVSLSSAGSATPRRSRSCPRSPRARGRTHEKS